MRCEPAGRPGPDPGPLAGDALRGRQRVLPGLDRRQLRPLSDPLLQHVFLTLVSIAIGFAISFGLALLAHRHRWLVAPITQVTGVLYTLPASRSSSCCCRSPGAGRTTAIIALVAYSLLIIFRNITHRARQRARRRRRTRAAAWALPTGSCSGGWRSRWPCPRSSPASGSPRPPRSASRRSPSSPARAGWASGSSRTSSSSRTWSRRAGSRSSWRRRST